MSSTTGKEKYTGNNIQSREQLGNKKITGGNSSLKGKTFEIAS
jgi:hypothetical protein